MVDNCLPAWSHLPVCIHHQIVILFGQKEAGSQGIDPDARTVLLRHMRCQPLREVGDGCLGCTVGWYTGQGLQTTHGGDVDDAALSALGHVAPKDLATLEGSGKIQSEDVVGSFGVQVKEAL